MSTSPIDTPGSNQSALLNSPPHLISPPRVEKRPIERSHHGHTFADPYEWLREKENPEVIAYLEAENAWTEQRLMHQAAAREGLFQEIKRRTQETDLTVPVRRDGWWYYSRIVAGEQYPVISRMPVESPAQWEPPVLDAEGAPTGEEVLLDLNAESAGHEFFSLGGWEVNFDGSALLYSIDVEGDERYVLFVRDIATRQTLSTPISDTAPGAVFDPTGRYVFYTTFDDAWRPDSVWRHELGTSASADKRVFHEADEHFWLDVSTSRSGGFIQIDLGSKITTETWLLSAADPTGEFRVVWPRRHGVEYVVEHALMAGGDSLLVLHNDNAPNFELISTSVPGPTTASPVSGNDVLVAHDPAVRLLDLDAFASHVVLSYRRDSLPRVGIASLCGPWTLQELDFEEQLFNVVVDENPDFQQPNVRLSYASFVTPKRILDVDAATASVTILKEQAVLGGFSSADYAQSRFWALADDGTRIPVSLVWKKDALPVDDQGLPLSPAPLVLYGYGSYETSIDPTFSVARLSLLDRGVVFAVAHVRGGGEMGRHWYEEGKSLSKRNTFTDFVACGRSLVAAGWTASDRMVAQGRSAGGLLMGAVVNLAPDLFAGIVADVPFVDALTSILDPELPLTVIEWDEWGNPLEDRSVYDYMRAYTPYENVAHGFEYPKILVTTSLNDTRVLYVEPAKWVARLRDVGADVVFKTEMSAGHGGVSGRYARWTDAAFEDAWVLEVLGLNDWGDPAANQ